VGSVYQEACFHGEASHTTRVYAHAKRLPPPAAPFNAPFAGSIDSEAGVDPNFHDTGPIGDLTAELAANASTT
jgi:hypothetical protein